MIMYLAIAAFILLDIVGTMVVLGWLRRQALADEEWPTEAGPDEKTRWIRPEPARRIVAAVLPDEPTLAIKARPMYPGRER